TAAGVSDINLIKEVVVGVDGGVFRHPDRLEVFIFWINLIPVRPNKNIVDQSYGKRPTERAAAEVDPEHEVVAFAVRVTLRDAPGVIDDIDIRERPGPDHLYRGVSRP